MQARLPEEIRTRDLLPDGTRYVFPSRNLGAMRIVGVAVMGMGVVMLGFAAFFVYGIVNEFLLDEDAPGWFFMIPVVVGLLVVPVGLIPIVIGAFLFGGHCEIELHRGTLRLIERVGPFRKTWSRPAELLTALVIKKVPIRVNDEPVTSGPLADLAFLQVESDGAKRLMFAAGYPREWVTALAQDLVPRLRSHVEVTESDSPWQQAGAEDADRPSSISITDHFDTSEPLDEDVKQPEGSQIQVEEYPTGVTLTVPPAGVWRGSKGLCFFGFLWCGIISVFSLVALLATPGDEVPWFAYPILVGLFAIGAAVLLGGINMGIRRAVLAVVDDSLMVLQSGLFGAKRREWTRDQIDRIVCGASGMEVNKRPVLQLQIHGNSRGKFSVLTGRDDAELRWIAATLRLALRLSEHAQTAAR